MADIPSDNTTAQKALLSNMQEAKKMADTFSRAASQATGEASRQIGTISEVYTAIAKGSKDALESQKKLEEIEKRRKKAFDELKDAEKTKDKTAVKKHADRLKEIQTEYQGELTLLKLNERQIDSQKKFIKEISNTQGVLGKFFDSGIARAGAYLLSTERIIKGIQGVGRAYQDVVDISLTTGSFKGLSGDSWKDAGELTKAMIGYGASLSLATYSLGNIGVSSDETAAAFKRLSIITGGASGATEDLTVATGYLARNLQVSLGDATEYVIESQEKFGRTGAQSARVLQSIAQASANTNKTWDASIIRGRDVAKVLFDITRESMSGAQEQDVLAGMITKNMAALQAQGFSYQQSLKASTTYIKKLTTDAPEWSRILAGKELYKTISDASKNGNIGDNLKAQLERAKPGLTAQVQAIMGDKSTNPYSKQRDVQALLQDTGVGLNAMSDQLAEVIKKSGGNAEVAIMHLYGITDPLEARAMVKQNNLEQKAKAVAEEFKGMTDAALAKMSDPELMKKFGMHKDQLQFFKDESNHQDAMLAIQEAITEEEGKQFKTGVKAREEDRLARVKKLEEKIADVTIDAGSKKKYQEQLANAQNEPAQVEKIKEEEQSKSEAATFLTSAGGLKGSFQFANTALGAIALGVGSLVALQLAGGGQGAKGIAGSVLDVIKNKAAKGLLGDLLGGAEGAVASTAGTGAVVTEGAMATATGATAAVGEAAAAGVATVGEAAAAGTATTAVAGATAIAAASAAIAVVAGAALGYLAVKGADKVTGGGYSRVVGAPGAWLASKIGPSDAEAMAQGEANFKAHRQAQLLLQGGNPADIYNSNPGVKGTPSSSAGAYPASAAGVALPGDTSASTEGMGKLNLTTKQHSQGATLYASVELGPQHSHIARLGARYGAGSPA
jgi:hypothetical protein